MEKRISTNAYQTKQMDDPNRTVEGGDIVVLVDENGLPGKWMKGRVVQVNLAKDNQVRSVEVKIGNIIIKRPAVKVAVVDVEQKEHLLKHSSHHLKRNLTVAIDDAQSQIAHIFICQTGRFDIFICQKKFIYLGYIILKIYAQSWRNLKLYGNDVYSSGLATRNDICFDKTNICAI